MYIVILSIYLGSNP